MADATGGTTPCPTMILDQRSRWPSSWRPYVLSRVGELDGILTGYEAEVPEPSPFRRAKACAARQHLTVARRAAERSEASWPWRGSADQFNSVSHACRNLYSAEAALIELAPDRALSMWRAEVRSVASRYLDTQDVAFQVLNRVEMVRDVEPDEERLLLASVVRSVASASQRYHSRLRSFRSIIHLASFTLLVTASVFALAGWHAPGAIPLCFGPDVVAVTGPVDGRIFRSSDGQLLVTTDEDDPGDGNELGGAGRTEGSVSCPTGRVTVGSGDRSAAPGGDAGAPEQGRDMLLVLFLGAAGGAITGAASLRDLSGPPAMLGMPVALALLKLPTGAITAVAGIVLVKGAFIPGLSVLDSPGQIAAWSLLLGISQQFITRMVDREGRSILGGAAPNHEE
ncbi:MAG: hypothetical protein S0880_12840 [Actinomycetota bacterium]|nr:hypothetical protein [Actinomycetota bacterium]